MLVDGVRADRIWAVMVRAEGGAGCYVIQLHPIVSSIINQQRYILHPILTFLMVALSDLMGPGIVLMDLLMGKVNPSQLFRCSIDLTLSPPFSIQHTLLYFSFLLKSEPHLITFSKVNLVLSSHVSTPMLILTLINASVASVLIDRIVCSRHQEKPSSSIRPTVDQRPRLVS